MELSQYHGIPPFKIFLEDLCVDISAGCVNTLQLDEEAWKNKEARSWRQKATRNNDI